MAIVRVFRTRIVAAKRTEFEAKFSSVSVGSVSGAKGFVSASIYKPTQWAPDEYAMISHWQDRTSVEAFAGVEWNRAKIPQGMEHLIEECWVHHYETW